MGLCCIWNRLLKEYPLLIGLVCFVVLCQICVWLQTSRMDLAYNQQAAKKNKDCAWIDEFVNSTDIANKKYTPYTFALNAHISGICYMILEILSFKFYPIRYEHEMVKLKDGGQLAISWNNSYKEDKHGGIPKKDTQDRRPILAIIPGLSGSSQNLYGSGVALEAASQGYKVCVVLQRGSDDMPVTDAKVTCSTCWEDIDEPLDYIYKNYCIDQDGKKIRNFYAYGCSLGAQLLSLYLVKKGNDAAKVLDATAMFAGPFNILENADHFHTVFYSMYGKTFGLNNNRIIKNMLPKMKPFMTEEEYERRKHILDTNTTGLIHLDKHIYAPMYGFKDELEYYKAGSIEGSLDQMKVPTFHLVARDDPPVANKFVPYHEIENKATHLMMGTTEKGSHAQHISGILWPKQWHPKIMMQFIDFMDKRKNGLKREKID